jgi:hypothetical protein
LASYPQILPSYPQTYPQVLKKAFLKSAQKVSKFLPIVSRLHMVKMLKNCAGDLWDLIAMIEGF